MHSVPILLPSPFWQFPQCPRSGSVSTGRTYPFCVFTEHSEFWRWFTAQIRRKLLQILGLSAEFLLPEEVTPHVMQAQAMRSLSTQGRDSSSPLCSWSTFTTEQMQLRNTSPGQTAAGTLGSPMRGTSGADTLLRRFFGWRNPTLFGEQHSAPLPLLVSVFGLRGRAVLAAWEVFLSSSQEKYRTEMREWGGKMSSCIALSNIFGIHLINITWPKPKNEILGCKETVTTFTYFSLGRQPGIAVENFPKPKEIRQYICLFRGFLVAFMAIITWSLYLDQRVIQHKIFWIDKLPFC